MGHPDGTGGDAGRRLRDQLYGGEHVEAVADIGTGAIAVTSHRVMALTPDGGGPAFRAVHRPNVESIGIETAGESGRLVRGGRYTLYGAVSLAAGTLFDPGALIGSVDVPEAGGAGAVRAVLDPLLTLIGLIDDALLLAGLVALLAGLAVLGYYLYGRERYVEIGLAGREPVRIPVGDDPPGRLDELAAAIETGSNTPPD